MVLAFLKIDFTYGRSILSGMLEEVRERPGLRLQLARSESELKAVLREGCGFLGVAGMIWNQSMVGRLRRYCRQVISFANQPPYPADRHILLNDVAIGKSLRKEFMSTGPTRCAAFCPEGHFPFRERVRGFREATPEAQADCPLLDEVDKVLDWVRASEEPSALMAVNDVHARTLVEACQEKGIPIPARLSVIGIDDDDVYVHLGRLGLSSMHLPFQEMGRQAVRDMCDKASRGPELREFEGSGIIHRETTLVPEGLPVSARRFLQYLRKARPLPNSVVEACRETGVNRRSLELALRQSINCSPRDLLQEERRRVSRIARSRGLSMQERAHQMGYRQGRSAKKVETE